MEDLIAQILGYLRGMWRYRWWGLVFAWIVGVAGVVAIYLMPDKFESTARVYVDTQSVLRPLMSGLAVQPNIEQQIVILSRTLISRPNVEKLITMADLDHDVHNKAQREALIVELTKGLQIRGTGRDNLFTLAYGDAHPARAQRIVQALVSLFVESGLVSKRQDTETARRFIEEQIKNYEQKLTEAENRLKDFRLRNMPLIGDGARDFVSQASDLTARLNQARLELKEAENSRDSLQRQLSGEPDSSLPTPELDSRIDVLKKNLDTLLQRFTEQHPDVVGTRRVIQQLEQQRKDEIEAMRKAGGSQLSTGGSPVFQQMRLQLAEAESRVAGLRARVGELEGRLAQLKSASEMLPRIEAELAQLNRDYDVHKRNYETLVSRRESANISVDMDAQSGVADFRVIDPPSLPTKPSAPNRVLLVPLAGIAALGAGLGLAFLISQLRPAFSDGRSLREITGLPLLGTVSMVPDPQRARAERVGVIVFGSGVAGLVAAVGALTLLLKIIQG